MRKILLAALFFVFGLSLCKYAFCEDNLLALDTGFDKKKIVNPEKRVEKTEDSGNVVKTEEQKLTGDDSDKNLEKMRSYRKHIENKQKELDLIKLDLEKSELLLKEKETREKIYQIDKVLPQGGMDASGGKGIGQDLKEEAIDPSDIKIQLLVISGNLKEGQISFKNTVYNFKEGDVITSRLTVEKIETEGLTLRETNGEVLKLKFID